MQEYILWLEDDWATDSKRNLPKACKAGKAPRRRSDAKFTRAVTTRAPKRTDVRSDELLIARGAGSRDNVKLL